MEPGDVVASRFELEAAVGAGAFGRVFRARDRETGRTVALKVVEEARPEVVERFRREASLLASIAHPNVVGHVASGAFGGRYAFLAMDWLEGEDLARRLQRGPLDVGELVGVARGVLAGLAAAHVLGIVHRDVKPSNVWLAGGRADRPRLLDFGLARLAAASTVTRAGTFLGTPEYMAPEQVKGAATLDQRADLFSLGCVLFECATGRTPFAAPTSLAVATRVLLDEPPRLDALRPDLPVAFADLVLQLLAKAPEDRPRVAAALELLDAASAALTASGHVRSASAPPSGRAERPSGPSEPPPAARRPAREPPAGAIAPESSVASSAASTARSSLLGRAAPFVGRADELEELGRAFDRAVREKAARAVVIEGVTGAGKSRLVREFLAALGRRAAPLVVALRGTAALQREPLGALGRATADALGLAAARSSPEARGADLAVALAPRVPASHAARVTAFLGELVGAPLPDGAHPLLAAARAEGARTGDQIARAWADWLDAETQQHPVVVVLDDAPRLDAPSLEVVAGAVRQLRRRRLLVLATSLAGGAATLPDALGGPGVTRIQLGPLARDATEAIARAALGDGVAPSTVAAIAERSAGIPLHVEELVRAAAAGADPAQPVDLEAMVARRLAALDADTRRVVEAASVLGGELPAEALAVLLDGDLDRDAVVGAVDRLVALELLDELGEPRQLAVRGATLRDLAYAGLDAPRRAILHGRAARWLARTGPWSPAVIAEHLVRAGEADAARAFLGRAASAALDANDFAGALAAAERALAAGAAAEELGRLRLLQADASRHLGEDEALLARATEACAALPPWSRPWFRAASLVVLGAIRLGRADVLDPFAHALAASARRGDLPGSAARAAHYLYFAGRAELADALLAATGDDRDAGPDRDAWVHRACATRALLAGDPATYLEHLELAIAAFEHAGEVREQAAESVNAGIAKLELGRWADAEGTLRTALEAAERAGLRQVEWAARIGLGEALFRAGRAPEALATLDAVIGALRRHGQRRLEGSACALRARLHLAAGEIDAALRDARTAVERAAGALPLRPSALAARAAAQLAAGHIDDAAADAAAAVACLGREARLAEGEAFVRRTAAEVALAAGRVDEAAALVGVARELLLRRAGRIGRDDWRASFLAIPDHARVLALHAWWTERASPVRSGG